jgi:cytochrome c-type biogenesis protein
VFENVESSAFIVQALIAFGAGVISFVSPCVLPLLPGYLSMMSGYSTAQIEAGDVSTRRLTGVILQFIGGFTLVFAALGAAASGLGQFMIRNMNAFTRIAGLVIIGFGILMVVMAASNRSFLGALERDHRPEVRPSRLGKWAPPVMGAAFAFGWSPCIGPVLTVILATAATQDTLLRGIILLVVYSLGLGIPFLLAGLGLFKVFGRLKPYLRPINIVSGVLLVGFGVIMVTGRLGSIANWFTALFLSVPFLRDLATV